jgi:hypothetical protein
MPRALLERVLGCSSPKESFGGADEYGVRKGNAMARSHGRAHGTTGKPTVARHTDPRAGRGCAACAHKPNIAKASTAEGPRHGQGGLGRSV